MDQRERKVVEDAATLGVFTDIYAHGATPDEVKEAVVGIFAPYAENQESLRKYAAELLVADAISLGSISDSHCSMELFREALRTYRDAMHTNRPAGLQALADHNMSIVAGLSIFWREYHTSRRTDVLALEEFAHESLRAIGTVIEGPMKPHLVALVHHSRIKRGEQTTGANIRELTLGQLTGELARHSPKAEVFSVRGVALNQWRNIAQHFSARVDGQDIVCVYGTHPKEVRLSREELSIVRRDVISAFTALKVAHVVVFFDHLEEMQLMGLLAPGPIRPEASLIALISALAAQGFEVVEAEFTSNESKIVVQDLSLLDPAARRFHSTQFVVPLFRERPADKVTVDYRERDGTLAFRTTATRELLEEAERTENWTLVAEKCSLTSLKGTIAGDSQ